MDGSFRSRGIASRSAPDRIAWWNGSAAVTWCCRSMLGTGVHRRRPTSCGLIIAPDSARGLQLLRNGQAEALLRVPLRYLPDLVQPAVDRGRWQKLEPLASQLVSVVWNGRHPLLGQAAVRRALGALLDRQKLLRDARMGLGSLDVLLQPAPKLLPIEAGLLLDAAQVLRAAPGSARLWQGRPLLLKLLVPQGSQELTDLATRIAESLAQAGIKVEPEVVELSALLARLRRGAFDAALLGWGWTGSDRLFDPEPLLHYAYPDSHPLWQSLAFLGVSRCSSLLS
jgi:ABC-type oligopeptide transport system substrate-binding subunit